MNTKEFRWGKGGPARGADNCAVLVVLNVKVRADTKYSISSLGLLGF